MLRVLCLLLLFCSVAWAHSTALSTGTYTIQGTDVRGELRVDPSNLDVAHVATVHDGQRRCPTEVVALTDEGAMVHVQWKAHCSGSITLIQLPWIPAEGHTHVATIHTPGRTFERSVHGPHENVYERSSGGSLFVLGVRHIMTGWDHLLFLFALALARSSRRTLVATLTAFTVGHAASLLLLGHLTAPARLVEPAIALSIALAGVHAALGRDLKAGVLLALPIGLVHGLGFADALRASLQERATWAALAFNGGVELGQLAFIALCLPCLAMADGSSWFRLRGRRTLGYVLALVGVALAFYRMR